MLTWANVAELVKAKTLDGGLVVRAAPGLPFLLEEGMEVAFVPPVLDAPRDARVESLHPQQDGRFLVSFDTVKDRDTAEALAGCFCLVRRDDLPEMPASAEDGGVLGYEAVDDAHGLLGRVGEVAGNPSQALLVIEGPYGEVMVPFVDEIVYDIDDVAERLRTRVPSGLLELGTSPAQGAPGGGRP